MTIYKNCQVNKGYCGYSYHTEDTKKCITAIVWKTLTNGKHYVLNNGFEVYYGSSAKKADKIFWACYDAIERTFHDMNATVKNWEKM